MPDYKSNLIKFINEARAKKTTPVLITPVTRMRFDKAGNIQETHKDYTAAVIETGLKYNVPVIDLDRMSRELLQEMGPEHSRLLFMQLDSLAHPNYPHGQKDNTHFNEYGARRMAELVLSAIKELNLELSRHIIEARVRKN